VWQILTGLLLGSIAYFVDAITLETPVLATGADGIATTHAICAIIKSAKTGTPIDL
jgi:hypothetical protein